MKKDDHDLVNIEVDSFLAQDFMDVIKSKVADIDIEIQDLQERLDFAKESRKRLLENYRKLAGNFSVRENKPNDQFWNREEFEGWRERIKTLLKESDSFMSLSELIDYTKEVDVTERRKLESSISNAITTLLERGEIGAIRINGERGRYYGSYSRFEKGIPNYIPISNLAKKLQRAIEVVEVSIKAR